MSEPGDSSKSVVSADRVDITTANTAQTFCSISYRVRKLVVQAQDGNIALGDSNVDVTASSENGIIITDGNSYTFNNVIPNHVYFDADATTKGVTFVIEL